LCGALAGVTPLAAQQRTWELGGQWLVTTADPVLVAGGLYAAWRPSERARLAMTLNGGVAGSDAAGRGELLAHFLLNPGATTRPGFYVGGGVAGVVRRVDRGYIVVLAGLEGSPGGRSGWALEAGVGGGIRVTAGWRWRRGARK